MKLREIAHSRTGDKGDDATVSVIVYRQEDYPVVRDRITAARVKAHLSNIVKGEVVRYELPQIGALNFVLHNALSGGVTRSLSLDIHGKSLSSLLLDMEVEETNKTDQQ
jgi:hypothetical protein